MIAPEVALFVGLCVIVGTLFYIVDLLKEGTTGYYSGAAGEELSQAREWAGKIGVKPCFPKMMLF